MAEYSRIASGNFISTGTPQLITLPFVPQAIEMWNYSSFATPAQHGIPRAFWDVNMGQGGGVVDLFNATPVLTTDVITAGGFSTVAAGQLLQYGPALPITSTTKGATTTVTTTNPHGLTSGNVVILQGLYTSSTTGMPQICGIPFVVTVTGASTFTILWNTAGSDYANYALGYAVATVKQVLFPALYVPGTTVISAISLGSTTTITTTAPHNMQVGQEVGFRITTAWGTTQLNSLPNSFIPGSPVYGFVTSVTNSTTVVVNINSSSFTAFNVNQPVAAVPGLEFPQMVAVGDVNSGYGANTMAPFYPSPTVYTGYGTIATATINGPTVLGAYINATFQGFVIGAGSSVTDAASVLVGSSTNQIYWRAMLYDYGS